LSCFGQENAPVGQVPMPSLQQNNFAIFRDEVQAIVPELPVKHESIEDHEMELHPGVTDIFKPTVEKSSSVFDYPVEESESSVFGWTFKLLLCLKFAIIFPWLLLRPQDNCVTEALEFVIWNKILVLIVLSLVAHVQCCRHLLQLVGTGFVMYFSFHLCDSA
jgi:hypothetical protein